MSEEGRIVVAKVGGSLLGWPPLPDRLSRFLSDRSGDRVILIAGGGGAADWVRGFDRIHALGEEKAHHLAVRSLDLSAHALAAILPGSEVVSTLDALARCWRSGRTPILAPRLVLDADDQVSPTPLPRSWDATTDAISARIARIAGAHELVLLKSVGPPPGSTPEDMARLGVVDPLFPEESRGIPTIVVVNLRSIEAT